MKIIIIIAIIFILLYLLTRRKKKRNPDSQNSYSPSVNSQAFSNSNSKTIETVEYQIDEEGRKYVDVERSRKIARKTYLKAALTGKYWGEIDSNYSEEFQQAEFYDLNFYEVLLKDAIHSTKAPFVLEEDLRIPRSRLPELLKTILEKDGKTYEVNLYEPTFSNIKFNRKLHQTEDNEVFGTIDAMVTGYLLDYITEKYIVRQYIEPPIIEETPIIEKSVVEDNPILIDTGRKQVYGDYTRTIYIEEESGKETISPPIYQPPSETGFLGGCFSVLIGIISIILGIAFILLVLPRILLLLPFFLIWFILHVIPERFYQWFFRILGSMLIILFFIVIIQSITKGVQSYAPTPIVQRDKPKAVTNPEIDTLRIPESAYFVDSIINQREWKDYSGNKYIGKFWTLKRDYINSKGYKQSLEVGPPSDYSYDYMVYSLKENDKNGLSGVYQMFDSLKYYNNLGNTHFAEVIVSFVQSIPYSLVLPNDCDPQLYEDHFIRTYLQSPGALCSGYERFGINTPIEFMSYLKGDCDTRTLFLYTILSHYEYDVVMLSSEYYSHSILGINLPIDGISYLYKDTKYVLWETTAPNIKPGEIPASISKLNYWRISLKSK